LLREEKMSALASTAKLVAGGILTGFALASLTAGAAAQQKAWPPDFSSNNAGWLTFHTEFSVVPGGTSPMHDDPAHPRVSNSERATLMQDQPVARNVDSKICLWRFDC